MVVEVLEHPHPGRRLPFLQRLAERVLDARRGRGGVLGIKRHHQHALALLLAQLLQPRRDRGFAVAHGAHHRHRPAHLLAEVAAHELRLLAVVDAQGRAVGLPDAGVFLRALARPQRQDEEIEDEEPHRLRYLHHARIGQELAQVAAHRAGRGRIGRAEVDQQDAGPGVGPGVFVGGHARKTGSDPGLGSFNVVTMQSSPAARSRPRSGSPARRPCAWGRSRRRCRRSARRPRRGPSRPSTRPAAPATTPRR